MLVTSHQSRILRWYYKDGLTQEQIADRLGITQSGVAHCIGRARARLRRRGLNPEKMTLETLQDAVVLLGLRDD